MNFASFGIGFLLVSLGIISFHGTSFAEEKNSITLTSLGTYESGIMNNGGAEIISYDPNTKRLFVTNDGTKSIDALSIYNPEKPLLEFSIDITPYGYQINSVDIHKKFIAAAIEPKAKDEPGKVVFLIRTETISIMFR